MFLPVCLQVVVSCLVLESHLGWTFFWKFAAVLAQSSEEDLTMSWWNQVLVPRGILHLRWLELACSQLPAQGSVSTAPRTVPVFPRHQVPAVLQVST